MFRFKIYFLKYKRINWTVARTAWTGDRPDARPVRTTQHSKMGTDMPRMGFEPTIPVFERPKAVLASDRQEL